MRGGALLLQICFLLRKSRGFHLSRRCCFIYRAALHHLNYRIKNAGLPWASQAEAGDCIVTVVPMFPHEFSQEQEAAIDRLVASNSGTAETSAGERMAAWNQVLDNWQARRK